jgi:hypothetical protein
MTTTVVAPTSRGSRWMRTVVLTVGGALLAVSLLPSAVRAETNQGTDANTAFQAKLCRAGGGSPEVHVDATTGSSVVFCHGGVYGGMFCLNDGPETTCSDAYPHPPFPVAADPGSPIWLLEDVLPVLEDGAPPPSSQARPTAPAGLARTPYKEAGLLRLSTGA